MYYKLGYIVFGLCGGIVLVAANYDTIATRSANSTQSYGRLLSDAYRVIVNQERQKGTFTNIDYFTLQADSVVNSYNPRPLTTAGLVNNLKNRRELRLARFELERFMNGYAGRVALSDVAMMHAAFDCRVRNIEINPSMDRQCQHLFLQHKQKAESSVEQYLNTNQQKNNRQLQSIENIQPEKLLKPKISIDVPKNQAIVKPTLPTPVTTEKSSLESQKSIFIEQQQLRFRTEQEKPIQMPPQQAIIMQPRIKQDGDTQKFNPLNYIHSSLRNPALNNQQKDVIKSQEQSLVPENDNAKPIQFGIKPTSPVTVSGDTFKVSPFKPELNYKQPLNNDINTTESVDMATNKSKLLSVNIPFLASVSITKEGQKQLNMIANILKHGEYHTITIIGHADQGNNNTNDKKMSLERANKIKNTLKDYAKNAKITIQAMGSSKPIGGISADDNRNRRTQIILQ